MVEMVRFQKQFPLFEQRKTGTISAPTLNLVSNFATFFALNEWGS